MKKPTDIQFPTLYSLTGDIKDINTVMINRAELRGLFSEAWGRFVQLSGENDGLVDKKTGKTTINFIGGIDGYRKQFQAAVSTIV